MKIFDFGKNRRGLQEGLCALRMDCINVDSWVCRCKPAPGKDYVECAFYASKSAAYKEKVAVAIRMLKASPLYYTNEYEKGIYRNALIDLEKELRK